MVDQYMKTATWTVCPICDEDKCVGKNNCDQIKKCVEKLKNEEASK